ncbi:MAG: T9SS type A sorting domain-containing protein [Microscillaceae bacterium]|nr:T9SS type A sorting domain-containing protein [Microscillaceae bacterium]
MVLDNTATTEASPGGYIEATNRRITMETDVAGLGFIVDDADITLLRRSHYQGDGGKGIRRIFRAEGTPSNSLLGLEYAASELGGIAENNLAMFRWDATNGWEDYPVGLTLDVVNNRVSVTGVNAFSTWTLGDTNNPLPIRLGPFTATLTPENNALLQWRTYTEEDNLGFWVEKSLDGLAFAPLGFVEGAGNSNQPLDYQFVDTALRQASYYRLKQTDGDGSMHVSPVLFVNPSLAMRLQIWPNPAQTGIQIQAWGFDQSPVSAKLYDARGKLLDSHYGNIDQIAQSLNRRLPHLGSGLYVLRVLHPQGVFTERIVKE